MLAFGGASVQDTVAEWLRRWTANPMCSARVGSSPTLGASFWLFLTRTQLILVRLHRCTQSLRRHGLVG